MQKALDAELGQRAAGREAAALPESEDTDQLPARVIQMATPEGDHASAENLEMGTSM